MRTSRVSRDAARLAAALLRSPRRQGGAAAAAAAAAAARRQNDDVDGVDVGDDPATSPPKPPQLAGAKRKRGRTSIAVRPARPVAIEAEIEADEQEVVSAEEVPTLKVVKEEEMEETTVVRRSPRKVASGDLTTDLDEHTSASGMPRRPARRPAKRIKGEDGTHTIAPPEGWEDVYRVTKEMRALVAAPVDTMGCESLAETSRSPRDQRFQTLVSLMLSSQTKDTVTAVAMKNLQANLPGGLTLEAVLAAAPEWINAEICKVGFHNNKTKFIKAATEILRDRHGGDIPDTIAGFVALPGVGPKMAYLCMSAAWGRDEGIGVDVHVHRITNLWGWHKTATPEETRLALQAWLPRELWHDVNHLLVGFGQTWCPPVGRRCGECRLAARGLCPSAVVDRPAVVRKRIKKEEIAIEQADESVKLESMAKQEVEVDIPAVKVEDAGIPASQRVIVPLIDIEDLAPDRRRSSRLQT